MNPLARFGTSGLAGLLGGNQGALFPYLGAIGALLLHLGGQQGGQQGVQRPVTPRPTGASPSGAMGTPPSGAPGIGTPPVLPPWAGGAQPPNPNPSNPHLFYDPTMGWSDDLVSRPAYDDPWGYAHGAYSWMNPPSTSSPAPYGTQQ